MAFVLLSSSAADLRFRATASSIRNRSTEQDISALAAVRRPHRGIQIKDDTYSTLSVFRGDGTPIPLVSSSARDREIRSGGVGYVNEYADYILQEVVDQRMEKHQIVETFGDSFIFMFGERPRMITFRGLLMNTEDFNWRAQFWANYDQYVRGTKLVEQNARAFIAYDSIVVEGYPISAVVQDNATNKPYDVPFEITMFVTNYQDFSSIGKVLLPDADKAGTLNLDVLNRELATPGEDSGSGLLSGQRAFGGTTTAADVRQANLFNAQDNSIRSLGGVIRETAKLVSNNAITRTLSYARSGLNLLLTGRVISRPVGSAGFLAQIGQAGLFAQNSLPDANSLILGLETQEGINIKVRVPGPTQFVDNPNLRVPLWQNYDEYPLMYNKTVPLSPAQREIIQTNRANELRREAKQEIIDKELLAENVSAQAENDILRTIADVVQLARTGFALARAAEAFINDPAAVAADAAGVSGIDDIDFNFDVPGLSFI